MCSAIESILRVARNEVGYLEKRSNKDLDGKETNAGDNNYTKYARDLDAIGYYNTKKNGYAWCTQFVDWCRVVTFGEEVSLAMTGQHKGGLGASCTQAVRYYKQIGRFVTGTPEPGYQIFFVNKKGKIHHTGIVDHVACGKVYVIEGNTSPTRGVVDNGGGVWMKCYKIDDPKIGGYGVPNYGLVNEMEVEEVDNEAIFENYRKELQDNDCSSWSEEGRAWAISVGLIKGSGFTEDGKPNYMWQDFVTREQLVTMLNRFAKLMGQA